MSQKTNDLFCAIDEKNTQRLIELMVNELPVIPGKLKEIQELVQSKCQFCESRTTACDEKFKNIADALGDVASAVTKLNDSVAADRKGRQAMIFKMLYTTVLIGILLLVIEIFDLQINIKELLSIVTTIATV